MKITRTANAGVLLKTDGLSILLDGICGKVEPYLETPDAIREKLTENFPDVLAFTHKHADHYDVSYAEVYEKATLRPVYGSEVFFSADFGGVNIASVPTRHIGKNDIPHTSFIIKGSKCIWFMGDASPLEWKKKENLPTPDVIIAPFAYANTASAWKMTESFGAETIVIVHMPDRENDTYGIWEAVENTVGNSKNVFIPKMGESIIL